MPSRSSAPVHFALGLLLFLAGLGGLVSLAGAEPFFPATSPKFAADVSTHLSEDGRPSVHVEIQVPYSELEFVRVGAGYGAALEFVVVVRAGRRQAAGDVWDERFVVESFEDSHNPAIRVGAERTFPVPEGRYRVEVQVRDLNGGQESEAEVDLAVAGLGSSTLGLTDLVFGECDVDSASGAEVFQKNASRRYGDDLDRFCIESAVLDLAGPMADHRYRLHWRIRDATNTEVASADTVLVGERAKHFHLRPPAGNLFLGSYEMQLDVQEGSRRWSQSGSFEVEALTAPRGAQWAVFLEILEYIATPAELEPLRKAATPEERSRSWKAFWQRRDPTPGTARNESLIEFMRRIRYANAGFQGMGPGWQTDQGHIYIEYGAPDQVEDIPGSPTTNPTQIWHYYQLNKKYVFMDRDGFGRYVLVPDSGP